jgi:hypothetical protein
MIGNRPNRERRRRPFPTAIVASAVVVALSAPAARTTTYVLDASGGGDHEALTPAVAAAATGDTILVAPGHYTGEENSRVDFLGKDVVLKSTGGPEVTTFGFIHGPGFRLESGETEATVIEGLTLTAAESSPVSYAVMCDGSAVTIRDCIFTGISNIALFLRGPRESTVSDCQFTENASGIWLNGVEATIRSCTFTENGPPQYFWHGAAIGMSSICREILIEDCTFVGNFVGQEGGAIENSGVDQLLLVDCVFEDNVAGREGGAISFHEYYPPMFGGPQIIRCTFTDNRAEMGAAVMSVESAPRLDGCLFESNRASLWGGGFCADGTYDYRPSITHCTFTRNRAYRGAALLANDGVRPIVEYCTFYGCGADDGMIASLVGAFVSVTNSIVSFAPRGDPFHLQFGTATVEHCVVFGNAEGDWIPEGNPDNLFVDPRFCDVYDDDFTLCENSPCLEENNAWGEPIGAHGAGCGGCDTAVEVASWGKIKGMYR